MSTKTFKHNSESQVVFSELMLPSHSNFGGKIHGGFILNLMDQIAFACASKHSGHYCVTANVGSVDFLSPIEIGELVTMKASINYVGSSSMVVGIRVDSENIRSGEKKHCNSSFFTMVAKNDDGSTAREIPGLVLKNKTDVRRFVEAVKRKDLRKTHEAKFNDADFDPEPYLSQLKSYKLKLNL